MQAMLEYFPSLLDAATASPLAAAVAAFLHTSPSMKKLDSIRDAAFSEVLPETARQPHNILAEVRSSGCSLLLSFLVLKTRCIY